MSAGDIPLASEREHAEALFAKTRAKKRDG
jgi:hypothetical protein